MIIILELKLVLQNILRKVVRNVLNNTLSSKFSNLYFHQNCQTSLGPSEGLNRFELALHQGIGETYDVSRASYKR